MFIVVTEETGIKKGFHVDTIREITPNENGSLINVNGTKIQVKESLEEIVNQTLNRKLKFKF